MLTLVTACYLSSGAVFQKRSRQRIEVANEMLLLTVSVLIMQCLQTVTPEEREIIGDYTLAVVALIFLLNFGLIGFTVYNSCKEKKRKKMIAMKKKAWEGGIKEQKERYLIVLEQEQIRLQREADPANRSLSAAQDLESSQEASSSSESLSQSPREEEK